MIYSTGVRYGGEHEWDFVWNRTQTTHVVSEAEIMMMSLGRTQHPWLMWRHVTRHNTVLTAISTISDEQNRSAVAAKPLCIPCYNKKCSHLRRYVKLSPPCACCKRCRAFRVINNSRRSNWVDSTCGVTKCQKNHKVQLFSCNKIHNSHGDTLRLFFILNHIRV